MIFAVAVALAVSSVLDHVSAGEPWSWQGSLRNDYEKTGTFIGTAPACMATSINCVNRGLNFWYAISSGDGHYCSSGRKVYCNKFPSPYTNTWWSGTATFCKGGCGECVGGSTCVATDGSGDGLSCWCAGGFAGCTNEKALCATYSSRRLQEDNAAVGRYNISRAPVQKGIDAGFYLYFGDDFEDDGLFEEKLFPDDFKAGLAAALTDIVPGVTTAADSGYVKASGFTNWKGVGRNFSDLFVNVTALGYINVRFAYTTEGNAGSVREFLQDPENRETFISAIEDNINALSFGDLSAPVEVHFVEANTFVTDLQTFCEELVEDLADAALQLDVGKVFIYQFLVFLFFALAK